MGTFTEPGSKVLGSEALESAMPDNIETPSPNMTVFTPASWNGRIVCRLCKYYVLPQNLARHLRQKHGMAIPRGVDVSEYSMSAEDFTKGKKQEVLKANQQTQRALKAQLMEIYGPKCACCGESNSQFLTLDHINNDGAVERKECKLGTWGVFRKAVRDRDKTRYQILCYNCNFGRAKNGGVCPHRIDLEFQLKKTGEAIANQILAIKKVEPVTHLPPKNKYDMSCR